MAFNAQELRGNLAMQKPASPAYFEAQFDDLPKIFSDKKRFPLDFTQLLRDFKFRIQAIDLPSRQLETQPKFTNGPQRMVPYGLIYQTINIEVIEGKAFRMREFFDAWHEGIFSEKSSYKLKYYDDLVASSFRITAYSSDGRKMRTYVLKEVYPVAINASQMNWSSKDQYLVIPIELAFHEWETISDFRRN